MSTLTEQFNSVSTIINSIATLTNQDNIDVLATIMYPKLVELDVTFKEEIHSNIIDKIFQFNKTSSTTIQDILDNIIFTPDDLIDPSKVKPDLTFDNLTDCDPKFKDVKVVFNPITGKIEYYSGTIQTTNSIDLIEPDLVESNLKNISGMMSFGSIKPNDIRIGALGRVFKTDINYFKQSESDPLIGLFKYNLQVPSSYMSNKLEVHVDIIDIYNTVSTFKREILFKNNYIYMLEKNDININVPFFIEGIIPVQYNFNKENNISNLSNLMISINNKNIYFDLDVNINKNSGDFIENEHSDFKGIHFYVECILYANDDKSIEIKTGLTGTNYNGRFILPNYFSLEPNVDTDANWIYQYTNLNILCRVDCNSTDGKLNYQLEGSCNPNIINTNFNDSILRTLDTYEINSTLTKSDILRKIKKELISTNNDKSKEVTIREYDKSKESVIFKEHNLSYTMKTLVDGCSIHKSNNTSLINHDTMNKVERKVLLNEKIITKNDINSIRSRIRKILTMWNNNVKMPNILLKDTDIDTNFNGFLTSEYINNIISSMKEIQKNLNTTDFNNKENATELSYTQNGDIITIDLYNDLINSYNYLSSACVCNSDCACNSNCLCNSNCGLNSINNDTNDNNINITNTINLNTPAGSASSTTIV